VLPARWWNSVAVRVPADALAATGMHVGEAFDLRAEAGRLILETASENLEDLLVQITPENCHALAWEDRVGLSRSV